MGGEQKREGPGILLPSGGAQSLPAGVGEDNLEVIISLKNKPTLKHQRWFAHYNLSLASDRERLQTDFGSAVVPERVPTTVCDRQSRGF